MAKDAGKVSKNAKVVKDAAQSAASKAFVRVIVSERSDKTGAYVFKEKMIHKDKVKEFLATSGQ
ncbi:MAG TPA: DUF4295 family protein [Chitinophagales bacterium]|jgi:hypothetical protein|nr:DUF4295 family protein [Chitinophagaceae bacterium]MBP9882535.1 DUF4295 family protein [Chitinophagales bacterium]HUM47522.1 DUF4295 family protein [Chitinophagales bacterium]